MENILELQEKLKKVISIEDPLKKRLWTLAVITAALHPYKIRPILIGGGAVEYYTFGGYSTFDIDIAVSDHQILTEVMDNLGLKKQGRYWVREDLDIVIESPAGILEGEDAPLTEVRIEDINCYIIGLEDLIIDRLNGYVHWQWEDDRRWVMKLIT
ncbi:MAG: UbiD family decarboxylase, partial [Candidatus Desantisbacteria bacterium]